MTDEAKALVERLEEWALTLLAACEGGDLGTDEPAALMYQARDRIEALETQLECANEALRERLDICETQAREIERLRGALGDLIEAVQRRTADLGGYDGRFGLNKSIVKARAAFAGDSHD